jgi:hypothetical protein
MEEKFATTKEMIELTAIIIMMPDGYLRSKLVKLSREELDKTNRIMLELAIRDKKITEEEIKELNIKYGATRKDIAEIFKVYYDTGLKVKDGTDEDRFVMITLKTTAVYRMKDYIEKKHNLLIMTQEEAADYMEKIRIEEYKRQNK